ncbi:MAG TPA: hypothetical protein VH540_12855 [Ktedonobacterales bacterium]|jgi:DnaJ-domain-containing protein 1
MTERLRQVLEHIEQLAAQLEPAEQDVIAEALEDRLSEIAREHTWDKLVSSPASLEYLDKLFAEAEAGGTRGRGQAARATKV